MMKVAKITKQKEIRFFEEPIPEVTKDDDVLVKIERLGICASDIHYFTEGKFGTKKLIYPATFGHQCMGKVIALGQGGKRYLIPGMTVTVDPTVACTVCDQCLSGHPNRCRHLQYAGSPGEFPGMAAEYRIFPARNCVPVPSGFSMDDMLMTETLAVGLHALSLSGFFDPDEYLAKLAMAGLTFMPINETGKWVMQPVAASMRMVLKPFREKNSGKKCLILGAGPVGLGILICSKLLGVRNIMVVDPLESRLNMARFFGATRVFNPLHPENSHFVPKYFSPPDSSSEYSSFHFVPRNNTETLFSFMQKNSFSSFDFIFECTGDTGCTELAPSLLAPGGSLVQIGTPSQDTISLNPHLFAENELQFISIQQQNFCFRPILDWITSMEIHPQKMQTHSFPFSQIQTAFEMLMEYREGIIKAVITI
ncbi:MAG: zinc-binding dehydrogenase [Planctomycetia bacterium]|nr:zinc-binding dehydrogenase [Planctomycetia bacterium]